MTKKHKIIIAITALVIAIAAVITAVYIGYSIGYSIGKNHVIYSQEIYTDNGRYIAVIDGDAHSYN